VYQDLKSAWDNESHGRAIPTGNAAELAGNSEGDLRRWIIGRPFRESALTTQHKQAEKFLQKRLAEVSTGNFIRPRIERIPNLEPGPAARLLSC